MEAKTDQYRVHAFQCEKNAKEATDPAIKCQWEELAIQWHYMANQAAWLLGILQSAEAVPMRAPAAGANRRSTFS